MTAVHAITTTAGHTVLAGAAVEQLKASLRGELLLPDDDRYEETRRVWNESSTPRIAERGRRAPRASSATRPKLRVKASTIRLVSL